VAGHREYCGHYLLPDLAMLAVALGERMFISRRTVQFHVSNILAKLGLSSRVELAALVARRGADREHSAS